MDSLTQFVLGSAVSMALLGPKIGARKAALIGGALGTVPDLDTFLPADDAVDAFVSHRGASHSLVVHALAAPVVAEGLVRIFAGLTGARARAMAAVFLIFATHAVIDAMTIYGTRLFWPLYPDPVGVGSVFIIDPLYTLPLLIVAVWGLFKGAWPDTLARWTTRALAVSTLYMAATVPLQAHMHARAEAVLARAGITPDRLLTIPTPFNVLFWKAVAVEPSRYVNLYLPVFGDDADAAAHVHPRRGDLTGCLADTAAFAALADFSKGFYGVSVDADGRVVFADLRMGLTPNYVFRFAVARVGSGGLEPIRPPQRLAAVRSVDGDWDWLRAGLTAGLVIRPAEAQAAVPLKALAEADAERAQSAC
jgi:inner membrane protein